MMLRHCLVLRVGRGERQTRLARSSALAAELAGGADGANL